MYVIHLISNYLSPTVHGECCKMVPAAKADASEFLGNLKYKQNIKERTPDSDCVGIKTAGGM